MKPKQLDSNESFLSLLERTGKDGDYSSSARIETTKDQDWQGN